MTTLAAMSSGPDDLIGRFAVHYKLITVDQLAEVNSLLSLAGGRRQITDILVEMGYLNQHQIEQLLVVRKEYLAKRQAQSTGVAAAAATSP
ncbi:MAG: hypothetical protein M3O15_10115, partial [Acidobacteriota bacterium]|nr:hypothetical protein [Acidobacteriota bacterium]